MNMQIKPEDSTVIKEVKESTENSRRNLKIFAAGFGGLLVLAVVVSAIVGVYRVYAKAAVDPLSLTVAKVFRLPIAKVNGYSILYRDYISDLAAINKMKEFDAQSGGPGASLTAEQMSDQVLFRLVNNILVKEAAAKQGLTVEPKDLEELRSQIISQFNTEEAASDELGKRYGWDMKTYTTKVMVPFVLQNKLAGKIDTDLVARELVRSQAENVLTQIKGGADFAELAKQYGQDGTAPNGGDLGWFGKGEMVPQFENAVFGLKKGELSQSLVETPYGYHIIQAEDAKSEKGKDVNGKDANLPKVKARHILFKFPNLQDYLNAELKKADIHLYVNMPNPFEALKTQAS